MADQGVVLFYTIHSAFQLEKSLRARGIEIKLIPTPRYLSSDCGTSLRFPLGRRRDVEVSIAELDMEVEGIHELTE